VRKTKSTLILVLALFLVVSKMMVAHAAAESADDVKSAIATAFRAVGQAFNAGGDVSNLTETLNEALNLTAEAQTMTSTNPTEAQALLSQANTLAENVTSQAPLIKEEGLRQGQTQIIITFASVAAAIIVGILIYMFGPNLLWRLWLNLRKNYTVKVTGTPKKEKSLVITMDQVCAAVLGIILIIAVFVVALHFVAGNTTEPFSELGILGPNMTLGDYPQEVVAGTAVNLYVYIGNQMGTPVYYTVMIKIGDNNTILNPAPMQPSMELERILLQNENWTSPVSVTLTRAGLNQRIIFELWTYNQTTNNLDYSQIWGQVWLNVTAPP